MKHNDTWGSRDLQQHKHQVGRVEVTVKPASKDLDKSSAQQLESSKREIPAMETFEHKKEPHSSDSNPPEPEIFLQSPPRPAKVFKEEMLIDIEESSCSDDRVPEPSPQPSPDVELQLINIEESPSFDDSVPESEIQMPSPQPSPDVEQLDLTASVSELSIGTEAEPYDPEGRQKWEQGHMDYMGKDSFENIKKKLDRFLE
ncbi:GLYG2 protein, partial [Polyodon spathula]|nr:GLYG2 protein [Polyodon spathula]